eukprot:TRINITY_DN40389_c0_g1_i1.p1 TRINITY_DN40389_c0_g1~~TRINITY_DN40389_c0_g1_i1.p1  ORF type:complete len:335 (+),score=33.93 TRINITY_DN40389_c0_g1_i1:261-1265(+)
MGESETAKWGASIAASVFALPLFYSLFQCAKGRDGKIRVARWWVTCVFLVFSSFTSAFLFGLLGFFIAHFSIPKPSPVPAQCKIIHHSVDLRSDKVCQLGLLNYNAKNILLPSGTRRFRCRYDYYWTSVFKVQYKLLESNSPVEAEAEAPIEALPLDCRPDFSFALRTAQAFKVNETYLCKYTPGKSTVDIVEQNYFNCSVAEPTVFELIRRLVLLLWDSEYSYETNIAAPLFSKPACTIFTAMFVFIIVKGLANALKRLKILNNEEAQGKYHAACGEAKLLIFSVFIGGMFVIASSGWHHREFSRLSQLIGFYFDTLDTRKWFFLLPRHIGFR